MHACGAANVEKSCAAPYLRAEESMCVCRGTLDNGGGQSWERKKLLNKVIFVFFVHKKYSRSFVQLRLNH